VGPKALGNGKMNRDWVRSSQTLLRHSKPEMTAVYTHGNFDKALEAQRKYMEQLLATKPVSEATH
jgi:hypothetical protein